MKRIFIVTVVNLLALTGIYAQSMSIDNVHKVSLRSSDAIKEGTDVKGYYFFYVSDKIDKKTNEYTLRILDNNLKILKDIKFQDSKEVTILESSFNGTDLIFLFYNNDSRLLDYQVYGADGKKKFSYSRELSKKDVGYLAVYLDAAESNGDYRGLDPIEGKGFISYMPSREDKDYTFQLDYFSTERKKQWSYIPTEGKKFAGDFVGYFNGTVYLTVSKASSLFDNSPETSIVGLSLETGKVLFEKPLDKFKYLFFPVSMSTLNEKPYMYGLYFAPNANILKDNPEGFAFLEMNEKGTVLTEKYCSWSLDLGKFLDVGSRGKITDFGYMFLHSMIPTAEGDIYAVGEGYMKTANALGILGAVATGGQSMNVAKMKVTDMMVIKFDKDFNLKEAKIYDKNTNTVGLGSFSFMNTALLGKMLKAWGMYDYSYSQSNKENTSFTICYSDYVKGKDYKGTTFNAISYNEGKITTDKINTKSDATRSYILPGKQGQVLILEYYKKDKKLEAHFEKLN